mmetsp:Transcript_8384/g.14010  ORF Transcript_8384/g.14010 Transcript_8384/m.14010 type:complete len:683 (+) Transcript_8384:250-2298(+)
MSNVSKKDIKMLKRKQKKRELQQRNLKNKVEKDPFTIYGFGLIAYRNTLFSVCMVFAILSLIMYPSIKIYANGHGFNPELLKTKYGQYSIANLGYSNIQCTNIPIGMSKAVLQCPYGKIRSLVDNGIGINQIGNEVMDACLVQPSHNNEQCSSFIKADYVSKIFNDYCLGKDGCYFDVQEEMVDPKIKGTECLNKRSQFFVQYTCEQEESEQFRKYEDMAIVTASVIFVGIVFILLIYYLQATSKLDQKKYDVQTITAGDFTVELDISPSMFKFFCDNYYDPEKEEDGVADSRAMQLEKHLTREIEQMIERSMDFRHRHGSPEEEKKGAFSRFAKAIQTSRTSYIMKKKLRNKLSQELSTREKCQIQDIQFAYNNHRLLILLRERGTAIMNCQFDKMREIEHQIDEMVHDEQQLDSLTRPVCAFITFRSDDAFNEAIAYSKNVKYFARKNLDVAFEDTPLLNQPVSFTPATEPTNILWENRHIKGINYGARVLGAILVAFLMLIVSFITIIYFKRAEIAFKEKFRASNCQAIFDIYGNSTVETYAGYEYLDLKYEGGKQPLNGAMQCFCERERKVAKDFDWFINKGYQQKYKIVNFDEKEVEEPICEYYTEQYLTGKAMANVLKYIIIIFNYVIRVVVIKLINLVGCSTESTQMKYITDCVFACQFFNTGFLLMLCNANLVG